jgi:hypothetical protein
MNRRQFTAALGVCGLSGQVLGNEVEATDTDAGSAIRTALERGAAQAVAELGRQDGFMGNPAVRIALPRHLEDAAKLLRLIGQGRQVDELVAAMNQAAEAAVPEAKALFIRTARGITVQDAWGVIRGGATAATDYFAQKTRAPLARQFLPIVTRATEKVQLAQRYNRVAGQAAGLGLIKGEDANIQQYVTGRALDGLFFMVGEEEKRIRADPIGTGSALLRKVFGG